MSIILEILAFVGVALAAWFVATDKNRNDIFKAKLVAYQELNKLLSESFTLSIFVESNREKYKEK